MTSKRTPRERHRRTIKDSPADLWRQGRHVEAVARDPLIEFVFNEPTLTHEQRCEAARLRRANGWGDEPDPPNYAAMADGYIEEVTRRDRLAREFFALGPLAPDAHPADVLAMQYMNDPKRDDPE